MGQIRDLAIQIHKTAREHGWWDDDEYGDLLNNKARADAWLNAGKLMLMTSELAEALEDIRNDRWATETETLFGEYHPHGLPIELADVVIRILDYCEWQKIDLEEAIRIKMAYNETRPYKHGGKSI